MSAYIDVVFDGPPGPQSGRFVEVEDDEGRSIKFGEWIQRRDGYWILRFRLSGSTVAPASPLGKVDVKPLGNVDVKDIDRVSRLMQALREWSDIEDGFNREGIDGLSLEVGKIVNSGEQCELEDGWFVIVDLITGMLIAEAAREIIVVELEKLGVQNDLSTGMPDGPR